jgi:hypothetical protein
MSDIVTDMYNMLAQVESLSDQVQELTARCESYAATNAILKSEYDRIHNELAVRTRQRDDIARDSEMTRSGLQKVRQIVNATLSAGAAAASADDPSKLKIFQPRQAAG